MNRDKAFVIMSTVFIFAVLIGNLSFAISNFSTQLSSDNQSSSSNGGDGEDGEDDHESSDDTFHDDGEHDEHDEHDDDD